MVMGGIDLGEDYWKELLNEFDRNGDGKVRRHTRTRSIALWVEEAD